MSEKTLVGTLIVGQSGGPSSVINCSVYGAIKAGLECDSITRVYGASHGIRGILNDELMIMDEEDPRELENLRFTPSSALGSSRYHLPDPEMDDTDYKRILEVFRKYDVRYFLYNGGNDSMQDCARLSRYLKQADYPCRIIGVPKTIDNDLTLTDHCPGYGSAAKYIATSMMEVSRDSHVYDIGMVTIVECMGRYSGWLTAATALAGLKGDGPDLIYLPETPFDMDRFIADVQRVYSEKKSCLIAVSEGVRYADGRPVSDARGGGFGRARLGGVASRLADVVNAAAGVKVRGIELSLLQRCAAHCASGTDIAESMMAGRVAVEVAVSGVTDQMVGFVCNRESGYRCEPKLFDLADVADGEKTVPLAWINEEGNGIRREFLDYCLPLIQGETGMVKEDGLPRFARLKKIFAK